MNQKLLLALAGAALAAGIATTSAQAAPVVSGTVAGVGAKGVEAVRYDNDWRRHKPRYNRWNQRDNRWWWWQKQHRRDWSKHDRRRGYNDWNCRRDW